MGAKDVEPTRIERAREVIVRVSKEVPKARLSLVLLGDWPYTLVPPTDDPHVVEYFAQSLNAALIANLASSIRTAREMRAPRCSRPLLTRERRLRRGQSRPGRSRPGRSPRRAGDPGDFGWRRFLATRTRS